MNRIVRTSIVAALAAGVAWGQGIDPTSTNDVPTIYLGSPITVTPVNGEEATAADKPVMVSAAAPAGGLVDAKQAQQAPVVLRVRLLSVGRADKYAWYEVEILKVLKNESGETFGKTLKIAAYSWKPGVPEGESTVYLERYNATDKGLWKLVGGEAATGVSHAQKPAEAK